MEKEATAVLRLAAERGLPSLIIGGNAVVLLGYIRTTVDLDLLVPEETRSNWLDLLRDLGFKFFHGTEAFVQFEAPIRGGLPVDLMFVDNHTWQQLLVGARPMNFGEERVLLPRPENLVALKLHAASSPTRSKPEIDWEDIRQIVRICQLRLDDAPFRALVLRYGGEDAIRRIEEFTRE